MEISHQIDNNICIISLAGRIVEGEAGMFQDYVTLLFADNKIEGMVIDFEEVPRIDSTGVGITVSIFKMLEKKEIKLVCCQMNNEVAELFYLIRLDKVIGIYPTLQEALSIFQGPDNRYVALDVRIPKKMFDQLNDLTKKVGKSRSLMVEEALIAYLDQQKSH